MPASPATPHSRSGFEAEYPFESRFFSLGNLKYHYVDEGQGSEVVLCVHGNPTWSFAFRNVIKSLSGQRRVIAIDHIGCGFSDKPQEYEYTLRQHIENLSQFITGLDLKRITLLAHDWGGAIGMGTAVRMPDRFERLVLCNTAAFRSKRIPFRIAVCRWPLFGAIGVRGFNLFARAALSMAVSKRDSLPPAVRKGLIAPYGNWHDRVAIHRFVQDIPMSPSHPSYAELVALEDALPSLKGKPMLLLWGERDWCFTTHFRDEFLRRFPDAQSLSFPDAGHYVIEDARERLIARLREFLL